MSKVIHIIVPVKSSKQMWLANQYCITLFNCNMAYMFGLCAMTHTLISLWSLGTTCLVNVTDFAYIQLAAVPYKQRY